MKQVTQRLRDGRIEVLDVPPPALAPHNVLVDVRASLLSAGTERSKVQTAKKSLIGKARARPDQARQVIEKAQRDGLKETYEAVQARLDEPSSLGYSMAGVVRAVGWRVTDLAPGDRVACGGEGYAVHAELASVPGNLCVSMPEGLDFEEGAFATVGSIALHGVRQADARLGERVAVIGMGLVGQLTGQILRAAACRVVGIDLSSDLLTRALAGGSADAVFQRTQLTPDALPSDARACDAVIITAATPSADPIELAALLARDRARVVVVGDVALQLPRAPYYGKELDLRLSRSYGPGRYDRAYEERGLDYPIGYVRWTERRNMASFLDFVAAKRVDVRGLVSDRMPVDDAPQAYKRLTAEGPSPLGIVLNYQPVTDEVAVAPPVVGATTVTGSSVTSVGVIGAGNFTRGTLLPALRRAGFRLRTVASASGRSAAGVRDQLGFERAGTVEEVLSDREVGFVVIATRHDSHASLAASALRAGKPVFVEKPPCLQPDELADLRSAAAESRLPLLVGFNRRHAPLAQALRERVVRDGVALELLFRVNAGRLPQDHWLNDLEEGGGRLVGEGCHFVDFACWMRGGLPKQVSCMAGVTAGEALGASQSFTVAMEFGGGSFATIVYAASGATGLGKEYVECHSGGRSGILDDFRSLVTYDGRRTTKMRSRGRDKGHRAQFVHARDLLTGGAGGEEPNYLDSMAVTLAAREALSRGCAVSPAEAAGATGR